MEVPLKRVFFFLFAIAMLAASPALSVPLSSGIDAQGSDVYGAPGTTDPDGGTADGSAERAPEARIVDHQVAMGSVSDRSAEAGPHPEFGMGGQASFGGAGGGGSLPGWVLPVAGVAAGGGALLALTSHGHSGSSGSALGQAANLGASGSGGGTISMGSNEGEGHGHGDPGGDHPPEVPEPGTILLMGAGIASFLGSRRLWSS